MTNTAYKSNGKLAEEYAASIENPEAFWASQASKIQWYNKPSKALTKNSKGLNLWFEDGTLNASFLAIDFHIMQGRGDQKALIYDSPVSGTKESYTYLQLKKEVELLAGALRKLGVEKGDRVVIYMPMIPQAVFAMLACARIGAVHSVVFGGFAPHELAIRINDATPKVILSASCGIEFTSILPYKPLVDQALEEADHKPQNIIYYQRSMLEAVLTHENELSYQELLADAIPAGCLPVEANHPLYILYTSGTTGKPKGIVRDTGGYCVALKYSMDKIYAANPGEVFWAASDVGWVVGHSYIVYAPLIQGCTTILFEGKPIRTPDAGTFWRMIAEHQINILFTAPTAIRAIKKEDADGDFIKQHNIGSLKTLFLAGERCDQATMQWCEQQLRIPVIDHWWQTESGWPMVANMMGIEQFPNKPGSAGMAVPGYQLVILDDDARTLLPNQEGHIAVKLPLPPGCLTTLWKDDTRFKQSYLALFPNHYVTGDGGYIDEHGYVFIMGRIDDVINVAGHRLSTSEMEELVSANTHIAECAVIGIADELRGQRPLAIVVLKNDAPTTEMEIEEELVALIRAKIGAVAYFRNVVVVNRLPKTRSGKTLRKTMRLIADGVHHAVPSTIDDPSILNEIHEKLKQRKIGNAFA